MKTAKWLLIPVLSLLMGSAAAETPVPPPPSNVDPHKAEVIRELMDVTGFQQLAGQILDSMIDSERKANPDIDPAFWNRLRSKATPEGMLALVIPVYDRHFSTTDLEAAVAFYRSAPGQRILHEMPQAMKESMAAGEAWGRQLGLEVAKELQDERARKTSRM